MVYKGDWCFCLATSSTIPFHFMHYPELSIELSTIERLTFREDSGALDHILWWMQWPDITNLSATSNVMKEFVESYRQRTWEAEEFFNHWFEDDFNRFRSILALAGALVTGEQVLRYFDRCPPDLDSNLDIVTRVGGASALVLFLEHIGYELEPDAPSTHSEDDQAMARIFAIASSPMFETKGSANGVLSIFEFTRPGGHFFSSWAHSNRDRCARLRLIVVAQDPVDHILLNYHTSACLNVSSSSYSALTSRYSKLES